MPTIAPALVPEVWWSATVAIGPGRWSGELCSWRISGSATRWSCATTASPAWCSAESPPPRSPPSSCSGKSSAPRTFPPRPRPRAQLRAGTGRNPVGDTAAGDAVPGHHCHGPRHSKKAPAVGSAVVDPVTEEVLESLPPQPARTQGELTLCWLEGTRAFDRGRCADACLPRPTRRSRAGPYGRAGRRTSSAGGPGDSAPADPGYRGRRLARPDQHAFGVFDAEAEHRPSPPNTPSSTPSRG